MDWTEFLGGLNQGMYQGEQMRQNFARERNEAYLAPYKNYETAMTSLYRGKLIPEQYQNDLMTLQNDRKLMPERFNYMRSEMANKDYKLHIDTQDARLKLQSAALAFKEQKLAHPLVINQLQQMQEQRNIDQAMRGADLTSVDPFMEKVRSQYSAQGLPVPAYMEEAAKRFAGNPTEFYNNLYGGVLDQSRQYQNGFMQNYMHSNGLGPPSTPQTHITRNISGASNGQYYTTWIDPAGAATPTAPVPAAAAASPAAAAANPTPATPVPTTPSGTNYYAGPALAASTTIPPAVIEQSNSGIKGYLPSATTPNAPTTPTTPAAPKQIVAPIQVPANIRSLSIREQQDYIRRQRALMSAQGGQ